MNKFTDMIKANELRIGNYILYKEYGEGSGVIGKIKPGDFGLICGGNDEYHPIPLADEWLERCGSQASNGIEMKNDLWLIVHVDEGRANLYDIKKNETVQLNMPCQFVHQLQNLYFALTGEELTIKEAT